MAALCRASCSLDLTHGPGDAVQFGKQAAQLGLFVGLNYKFKTSNGTHNFTIVTPRDQAEIDALNAQINELRNRKPEVITKEVVRRFLLLR